MTIRKPKRLNKGDLIGIVTPASPVADPSRIDKGVQYLERLGYRVTLGENVGKVHGYLAGTDDERVADLHAFFADRRVKAIIAARGGYGTPRILSKLNYRLIAQNPKILVGFSDLTALQLGLWKRCGLITFHGPMASVEMANGMDPFTEEMFWRLLTSTKKMGAIQLPDDLKPHVMHPGTVTGRLIGGNLSLVVSLVGTRYLPDARETILFLEETGEEPYRIDRMMTQLCNAGVISKCKAIITGEFTDCLPKDQTKPSLSVDDVLMDVARSAGKPLLSNFPFGHLPRKMTLPIGLRARVKASFSHESSGMKDALCVDFLEAAVS